MTKTHTPSLADQSAYWDVWNLRARVGHLPPTSIRQAAEVERVAASFGRRDLSIVEIGCGAGWMCERLLPYGRVTGVDMTPTALVQARQRAPAATFICGDALDVELPAGQFDLVVCLEVLSHVADQAALVARLAALLRRDGRLALATQNRPVLERWSAVAAPDPNQIRRWVDHRGLRALLARHFQDVQVSSLVPVGDRGPLRFVNSPRLNDALGLVLKPAAVERAKERLMLGHTLFATATRRP